MIDPYILSAFVNHNSKRPPVRQLHWWSATEGFRYDSRQWLELCQLDLLKNQYSNSL